MFTTETEKSLHANEHFLWMQGRFVGAEKANRNGAFWSTEDLGLRELTVRNGPLNRLHAARYVIGTIPDTRMVKRDDQLAMDLDQPHISALGAIWRWIYPDEAWVIEQASDAGKLWYSMECVSKGVACVGDDFCGAKASYGDYMRERGTCAQNARAASTGTTPASTPSSSLHSTSPLRCPLVPFGACSLQCCNMSLGSLQGQRGGETMEEAITYVQR